MALRPGIITSLFPYKSFFFFKIFHGGLSARPAPSGHPGTLRDWPVTCSAVKKQCGGFPISHFFLALSSQAFQRAWPSCSYLEDQFVCLPSRPAFVFESTRDKRCVLKIAA